MHQGLRSVFQSSVRANDAPAASGRRLLRLGAVAFLFGLSMTLLGGSHAATPDQSIVPDIEVELLGEPVIEAANKFSENSRIRIQLRYPAGHPRAGQLFKGHEGPIRVEEWNGRIYDGLYGATRLPRTLYAPEGRVELTLKSLARYTMYDLRNMPVPQVAVYVEQKTARLQIPQWVDVDGNEKTDWLEALVNDILRRARASPEAAVAQAAGSLEHWEQSYRRDCGGFEEQRPTTIHVAPACLDWDGGNSHRLNTHQELSATILHELHHVWTFRNSDKDPRKRTMPKAAPPRRAEPLHCQGESPGGECTGHVWVQDPRYLVQEAEAEAFAERYKHLLP
jgi:hypothetical protein